MRTYNVQLTGKTPLLMHYDNIEWADHMEGWKNNPDNKKDSRAGDDRSPAWRWLGCVYHDKDVLGVPSENLMRSIMEGGAMVPVPGGKNGKTYKSQTQSGMLSVSTLWPLYLNGRTVPWSAVEMLKDTQAFRDHAVAVRALGFDLLIKRAKVGQAKHVRVRPEFPIGWVVTGQLAVWDEQITEQALQRILDFAGQYKGLGDWRPGGRTPGPYGTFSAHIKLAK
jgi:hypothetical protein